MISSLRARRQGLDPGLQAARYRAAVAVALALAIIAVLVAVEVAHVRSRITLSNLDYFGLADRAKHLPGTLGAWVNGFYPVGIPLLLRLGLALGVDVVRSGQAISLLGGIACLLGTGALGLSLTRSRGFALLVMAFVACSGGFLFYAGFEGSDMLAAGLQVLSFGLLLRDPRLPKSAALAGLVNGFAYLARYTALISFLLCAGYLVVLVGMTPARRTGWAALGTYVAGFALGAAPQLITSLIVHGTPFYMTQTYHIWIKLYAESDFIAALSSGRSEIGLWSLFSLGPRRFLANWWTEFWGFWFWMDPQVVDQPLQQLARAGWLVALFDQRLSREHRLFLLLYPLGMVGALSIFNLEYRFLLMLAPVFVTVGLYFVWRLLPVAVRLGALRVPARAPALLLLLGTVVTVPWTFAKTIEGGPHAHVVETSRRMRMAGVRGADEVVSTNLYHQDVASATRDHYTMLYDLDAPETLEAFRESLLTSGRRFIYFDDADGLRYYSQYESLLYPELRPAGFTPVWISEASHFAAYRIEPDEPRPQEALDAQFENGVGLVGYDLVVSQEATGAGLGLYLYWQPAQEVTQSLKVFVHLFDTGGQLVAQHDSVPLLWTYDTQQWQPGETIVDFHPLDLPQPLSAQGYTLTAGLYDGNTGTRTAVVSSAGEPVDDSVVVSEISLVP